MVEMRVCQQHKVHGGRCSMRIPERLMRLRRKSQLAKFGSIKTLRSMNCTRKEAWPIHVSATCPWFNLGKTGILCAPVRGVRSAFQTISRKKVLGLNEREGVRSLKERGSGCRVRGGRGILDVCLDIGCYSRIIHAGGKDKALRLRLPGRPKGMENR